MFSLVTVEVSVQAEFFIIELYLFVAVTFFLLRQIYSFYEKSSIDQDGHTYSVDLISLRLLRLHRSGNTHN